MSGGLDGHRGGTRGTRGSRPAHAVSSDPAAIGRRIRVVGAVLAVLALLPLWKLVEVQAGDGSDLAARGRSQRQREVKIPAMRGSILDRNGTELAISLPRRSVAVDMTALVVEGIEGPADREQFARRAAQLFGVDAEPVIERLLAADSNDRWVPIADPVDITMAERGVAKIEEEGIEGAVVLGESTERIHPAGESALRILGRLGADGPGELAGIERAFDEQLSGHGGRKVVERGRRGGTITGSERVLTAPVPGSDVMLTLDRTLQHEVEQRLAAGTHSAGAVRGVAIVGRPGSGELLAVASVERDPTTGEIRLSDGPIAFANAYQAGSVFKLVTVAAAVEAGLVDADSVIDVAGHIQVDDRVFSDHEEHNTEPMTVTRIVAESSNVGTIRIGQSLGAQGLHDALERFGFGSATGVGHPAESAGILPPVEQWTNPDLAASAIGTHQAATALQLWAAYNVIANGGTYVQPRLVDAVIAPGGKRQPVPSGTPRRVISEATAQQVGAMLQEVVRDGTGSMWNLPGYSVAAKTGTSRMVGDMGTTGEDGYTWSDGRRHHLAAFTGYLPADRPEVSITVILEDVAPGLTGSTAAGPVFSELAKLSIRELGIAPSHLVPTAPNLGDRRGAPSPGQLVRAAPAASPDTGAGSTDTGAGSGSSGDRAGRDSSR